LRTRPRSPVPQPEADTLPPLPADLPPPLAPFETIADCADLEARLLKPVSEILADPPSFPEKATSAHPLRGGEDAGHERLHHVVKSGLAARYNESRNGLVGPDFSTKLSAYLALGCLTARQVHEVLVGYEDGTDDEFKAAEGFGLGENEGTSAIRFELLWRDYMRLCSRRFKTKLFRLRGFWDAEAAQKAEAVEKAVKAEKVEYKQKWKTADPKRADKGQSRGRAEEKLLERFCRGTTGFGLVDASMRELIHTGYTSNRARQNVASFLTRRLGIDWRYGAEWYEMMLVDYDVSSNWANWQYVAGIGNDPKVTRIFNPVKQAFEYDPNGDYVRMWLPELAGIENLENLFQVSTMAAAEAQRLGLAGMDMVERPLERIKYYVNRKPPKCSGRYHFRGQRGGPQGGGRGSSGSSGRGSPTGQAPAGTPRGPKSGGGDGNRGNQQSNRGARRGGRHSTRSHSTMGAENGGPVFDNNSGDGPFRGAGNRGYPGSQWVARGECLSSRRFSAF